MEAEKTKGKRNPNMKPLRKPCIPTSNGGKDLPTPIFYGFSGIITPTHVGLKIMGYESLMPLITVYLFLDL